VNVNPEYYLRRHLRTNAPLVVYRFFSEEGKTPEVFSPKHDWQPDADVWLLRMSGELTEDDRITESEASQVIASWGGRL
jgi:hypothetical protein